MAGENVLKGIGITNKLGIGKAVVIATSEVKAEYREITDVNGELERYKVVKHLFIEETKKLAASLGERIQNDSVALVLQNHISIVDDIQFEADIEAEIRGNKICAESAVDRVCCSYMRLFHNMDNEVLKQRVADFEDIKSRLINMLKAEENGAGEYSNIAFDIGEDADIVLVAKELQPSTTATIDTKHVVGLVVENGGETSHAAILARAMGIPTVLNVKDACKYISSGETVVVHGSVGEVVVNPTEENLSKYEEQRAYLWGKEAELEVYRDKDTLTEDGERVSLMANIGSVEEAFKIKDYNADGIGLFRTEFLFMNGAAMPTCEQQYDAYVKAAAACKDNVLTIRTLDIGGDKEVTYMGLEKEINPFLGFRGIRLCLGRREMFYTQLKAILMASAYANIQIMLPLVTCIEEIRAVRHIIEEVKAELRGENVPYNEDIKIGIMVETPAAVMLADVFAKEVDFFSIGTNDLTQYTMAVDRGNEKVAYLFHTFSPAVLRSIKHIIKCANEAGIEVGMCGEAAGDPHMLPVLLGLGLRKFSVASTMILETRKNIAKWSLERAEEIADEVMRMTTAEAIGKYIENV